MNVKEFRKDFPLTEKVVYFDNAATSLTPEPVLEKMLEYYREYRANIHRGAHRLTERASEEYERVYDVAAKFFNAKPSEFVNVKNTTEAINALSLGFDFSKRKEVVTTSIEHHSCLLPWVRLEEEGKIKLKIVDASREGLFDLSDFQQAISKNTALVAFTATSNVLGNKTPVKEITKIAHDSGALVLVDAAQAVGHRTVDLKNWDCDFMAFSGHKAFGPTGTGALFHKEGVELKPAFVGGGTIIEAQLHSFKFVNNRERFEAGTPDIGGWIGLGAAFEFISKNFSFIESQEKILIERMMRIADFPNVDYYGPRSAKDKAGVFAFNVGKLKHHEVAIMFDKLSKICVRSGHHCAMPLHRRVLGVDGSVRASVHAYNTVEETELFFDTLGKIAKLA
jgi:cysteine desulfurase/selenocysteine lyase